MPVDLPACSDAVFELVPVFAIIEMTLGLGDETVGANLPILVTAEPYNVTRATGASIGSC